MENKLMKILAIDHTTDNFKLVGALCSGQFPHCKLITATSGKQGIEICLNEQPDIVLLETFMPLMDGYEICRALKASEAVKHIPVIMLIDNRNDAESRIKTLDAGADAFMARPLDKSEFTFIVNAILRAKQPDFRKPQQGELLENIVHERTIILTKELDNLKTENESLRTSEQNLQNLIDSMTEAMAENEVIFDENGEIVDYRILKVNKAFYRVLNLPSEIVMGGLASKLYGLSSDEISAIWKINLPKNTTAYTEMYFDASDQWFQITTSPLKDNKFVTTFFEITGPKKAKNELIKSEERFKQVIETSGVWVWEIDENGLYTYSSASGTDILGYTPEEIVGKKHFYDFFASERREPLKHAAFGVFSKREKFRNFINENVHKNGSLKMLETSGHPLYDETGRFAGYRGSDTDVTQREKARQLTKASEEKFAAAFKNAPVLLTLSEYETGKYIDVNNRFLEVSGFSRKEAIGKTSLELGLINEDERKLITNDFAKYNKVTELELNLKKKNGEEIICLYNGELINVDGQNCILSLALDITSSRRAEEALHESEYFFKESQRAAFVGSYKTDFIKGCWDSSEVLDEIFGIAKSYERSIQGWLDLIHPDDSEMMSHHLMDEVILKKQPFNKEYRIIRQSDGKTRWLHGLGKAVFDNDGKIISLTGTIQDITERKESEEKLNETLNNLKRSQEIANIGNWQLDLLTQKFSASEEGLKQFGFDEGTEPTFEEVKNQFLADDQKKAHETIVNALRTGKSYSEEYRIINKKTGEIRNILSIGEVEKNANGNPVSMFGINQDITSRKLAEQTLRESELRFESLFNSAADAIFIADAETGIILDANKAASELILMPVEKIIGLHQSQLHPPESEKFSKDTFFNSLQESEDQGISHPIEVKVKRSDGKEIPVEVLASSLILQGKLCLMGTFRDITERKKYEVQLQQSHDLLAKLSNQVPGVIYQYQLFPDGHSCFPYSSEGIIDIYEVTPDEVRLDATPVFGRLHPDDLEMISATIQDSARTQQAYHSEFRVILPRQGLRWRICDAKPELLQDGSTLWHGIISDITERKRVENIQKVIFEISNASLATSDLDHLMAFIKDEIGTLIDTTNFFVALYDEEADAITLPYYVDKKDKYTSFPAGKTMTGYVIKTGKPILANHETISKLEAAGFIERIGSRAKVWLGVPLKVKGKVTGAIVIQSYDDENAYSRKDMKMLEFVAGQISLAIERKKTEQELNEALTHAHESDRLKSAFLATMSHELRTPLNAVIGFSDLICEDLPIESIMDFAQIINNSGAQLLELVEEIFDITLLESGHLKSKQEDFLLNPLLTEIYEMVRIDQQKMSKEDILIKFDPINADNDFVVFTDPRKLKQIFMNLLKNALKFTTAGFVEFGYRKITNKDIPLIEFYVKDTGIGIKEESKELIFEIFRQGDDSHTRNFGGTGIGLSVAKKLTELLGGKISVESRVDVGSTFYFTIPYSKPGDIQPMVEEKTIMQTPHYYPGKTILVAEDEDSNYEFLEVVIKLTSAEIIRAKNGLEALKIFNSGQKIDLLLLDLKMPVMTGYQVVSEIRKTDTKLPIIAQTAYAMPGDSKKALEAGCSDYIAKPIKKQALLQKIEKYLAT